MSHATDRAASRHARDRDRDLLPAGPRLGPYELRYDVRRGYQQPLRGAPADASPVDVLFLRARDDDDRSVDDGPRDD